MLAYIATIDPELMAVKGVYVVSHHGSLQDYFRKFFCPSLENSVSTYFLMLNRNKTIKIKSFIESKIPKFRRDSNPRPLIDWSNKIVFNSYTYVIFLVMLLNYSTM